MTITERVTAAVILFPGYSAGYYISATGVTPDQFRTVAKGLTVRQPGDAGWPFSYTAYYPRVTLPA